LNGFKLLPRPTLSLDCHLCVTVTFNSSRRWRGQASKEIPAIAAAAEIILLLLLQQL